MTDNQGQWADRELTFAKAREFLEGQGIPKDQVDFGQHLIASPSEAARTFMSGLTDEERGVIETGVAAEAYS
ncbi:hypothetical protein K8R03_01415 [Candidatus Kaiserbacteria bacterium]|nr:hypothetical protein [Candidatus Kaiserbacteria bacterium]